jgi:hypothetical protein
MFNVSKILGFRKKKIVTLITDVQTACAFKSIEQYNDISPFCEAWREWALPNKGHFSYKTL